MVISEKKLEILNMITTSELMYGGAHYDCDIIMCNDIHYNVNIIMSIGQLSVDRTFLSFGQVDLELQPIDFVLKEINRDFAGEYYSEQNQAPFAFYSTKELKTAIMSLIIKEKQNGCKR